MKRLSPARDRSVRFRQQSGLESNASPSANEKVILLAHRMFVRPLHAPRRLDQSTFGLMCCVENMIDSTQNERVRTLELRSKLGGPRGACRSGPEAATADLAETPWENRASVSILGLCCAEPCQGGPFLPSFPPVSYERGH